MLSKNTCIDVVMAAKDSEKFILESISSVLNQDYTNWKLFVVDDHSSDETLNISKKIAALDSRIQVMSIQEQHGVYPARNYALKRSFSPLVSFLDSDDIWAKNFLSEMLKLLQSHNSANCIGAFSNFNFVNSNGSFVKTCRPFDKNKAYLRDLLIQNNITKNGSCQLLKRDFLDRELYFNENYFSSADYEILLRALSKNETNYLAYTHEPLLNYRLHSSSMSSKRSKERFKALDTFLPNYINKLDTESTRKSWLYNIKYALNSNEREVALKWMNYAYPEKNLKSYISKKLRFFRWAYLTPILDKLFPKLMNVYVKLKTKQT